MVFLAFAILLGAKARYGEWRVAPWLRYQQYRTMDRFLELAAFVRTVDRGSQAAAAPELGVTPAMVGRYVRALEDRLGTRLLNRTTATQSLTEAGQMFHAQASSILDHLEEAEMAASDRQAEPHGALRVNAPMVFGVRYLAAAAAEFGALHPRLRVDLSLNDRVVDLVEEGYDVAVRIGDLADTSLIARRLAPCRIVLCASPGYLRRMGAPERPEDLRGHNCLMYTYARNGGIWRLHRDGEVVEVRPKGKLVANNGDALLAAALADAGIGTHPTFIAAEPLRDGRLVQVLPDWSLDSLTVYAMYPSIRNLSPKVRGFVDFLVGRFGEYPPWDAGIRLRGV